MSSTNSANPLACNAGLAVIEEILQKKLVEKSKFNGEYLHKNLKQISKQYKNLFTVYGKGLIAAMIFNNKINNINNKLRKLVELCIKDGLLMVYTGRESVKIGPPLTITKDAIKEGTDIINKNIRLLFTNDKN